MIKPMNHQPASLPNLNPNRPNPNRPNPNRPNRPNPNPNRPNPNLRKTVKKIRKIGRNNTNYIIIFFNIIIDQL